MPDYANVSVPPRRNSWACPSDPTQVSPPITIVTRGTSTAAIAGSTASLDGHWSADGPALHPRDVQANLRDMSPGFHYMPATHKVAFSGATSPEVAHSREAALAGTHFSCPDVFSPLMRTPKFDAFYGVATKAFRALRAEPVKGENARYIPALQWRNTEDFAVSIVTPDGGQISMGDSQVPFSIQSISKPIDLLLALERDGPAGVNSRVANIGSPMPFNALSTVDMVLWGLHGDDDEPDSEGKTGMQRTMDTLAELKTPERTTELNRVLLERSDARPANAMSNMGALAMASRISPHVKLSGNSGKSIHMDLTGQIYNFMEMAKKLGRPAHGAPLMDTDFNVYGSEMSNSSGNQMLARQNVLVANGGDSAGIEDLPLLAYDITDVYTDACAKRMTIPALASIIATIANMGVNPSTGKQVVPREHAEVAANQMKVGGLYEASSAFFEETGLIAKSGVGGAIVAFHPESGLTIGTYSTPLDKDGNSARGMHFLRAIAKSPEFKSLVDSMPKFRSI